MDVSPNGSKKIDVFVGQFIAIPGLDALRSLGVKLGAIIYRPDWDLWLRSTSAAPKEFDFWILQLSQPAGITGARRLIPVKPLSAKEVEDLLRGQPLAALEDESFQQSIYSKLERYVSRCNGQSIQA